MNNFINLGTTHTYFIVLAAALGLIAAITFIAIKLYKKKSKKALILTLATVVAVVVMRKIIVLAAMYSIDFIGVMFKIPVIDIIDFLNELYYII